LGLRIDGGGSADRLRFVFSQLDDRARDREAWFELDTAARDYAVRRTSPRLDRARVDAVVARLNEERELVVLLKGMRAQVVEGVKSETSAAAAAAAASDEKL